MLRVVKVIVLNARHGEDRAGVDVHHNAVCALALAVRIDLLEAVGEIALNDLVHRQHKARAPHGVVNALILIVHCAALAVERLNYSARSSGQSIIVF